LEDDDGGDSLREAVEAPRLKARAVVEEERSVVVRRVKIEGITLTMNAVL
jgi:hypothetical protein